MELRFNMKCSQCGKDIPEDSVFCPECGMKVGEDRKEKPDIPLKEKGKHDSWFKNKSLIFFCVLLVVVIFLIYVSHTKKLNPKEFTITIGKVPAPYERMVAVVLYLDEPLEKENNLLFSLFQKNKIPLTVFISPIVSGNTSMDEIFNMGDESEVNLSRINLEGIEMATSSFAPVDLSSLPYAEQELLIKKAKSAWRAQGIRVVGFYPPFGSSNFETLLALENTKFEYMVAKTPDNLPLHPDSPLGIKMNILLLPLYRDDDWQQKQGIFVLALNPDALLQNRNETDLFLQSLHQDTSLLLVNASDMNKHIREREEISARIVTDVKRFYTSIDFDDLKNNTWLDIGSNLEIVSINTSNRSIMLYKRETGYQALLNESDTNIAIYWKKR